MAQGVVIRFKADSTEYDAKLKRSIEQMKSMEDQAKKLQGSIDRTDDGYVKFVQSLGKMDTVAKSSKTALREYSEAILYLQQQYKALSDTEKSGDVGKAMAASIQQLKVRAAEAQDTIGDLNEELKHMASDTSFTDGIGLMTRTVGSCAAAITAWTGDSKEMEAVIKDLAKIGTTVAAVDSLTKAFQKQNLVILKNPYVAAAAAVVALGVDIGKLIQKSQELSAVEKALQDVQAKGRENAAKEVTRIETLNNILHDNTRSLEERRSALAQIQSLVPDYHGALTAEGTLINDNTDALQGYIDGLQRAALAQAAFDKMVDIQKQKLEKQVKLDDAQKELERQQASASAPVTREQMMAQAGSGRNVFGAVESTKQTLVDAAQKQVDDLNAEIKEFNDQLDALQKLVKPSDIESTTSGKGGKTKGSGTTTTTKEDLILPEGSIAELEQKIKEKREELRMAITQDSRDAISKDIAELQAQLDEMLGKVEQEQVEIPIKFTEQGINTLGSQIKGKMSGAEIGSADYKLAADQLLDFTTFENLLKAATERGVQIDPEWMASLFEDIKIGADVDPETWQAVVDSINEMIEGTEFPAIKLDVKTGGVETLKKDVKDVEKEFTSAMGAVGALGNALQQIEDPAAKVAGLVAEAIATIALTFAKSLKTTFGPWDWIAAAASGTATMIATIAAIKSATKESHAGGGFIGGNSYSGDNMRGVLPNGDLIGLDSGELVLNAAQQSNVANAIQNNSPMGNMNLSAKVSGTDLLLVMDNTNSARGGRRGLYANIH